MRQDTLPGELTRVALSFYEGIGSPFAMSLAKSLRDGDWGRVCGVSVDPRDYADALSYFRDAAAASLLRKASFLPTGVDCREAAVTKWWDGERACYKSNERLSPYLPQYREPGFPCAAEGDARIAEFLSDVAKVIAGWIGPSPNSLTAGRFGPGSTYSCRAGRATVPDKIASVPSLTRGALWFLPQWLGTQWGACVAQHHGKVDFVKGNRFATVPKTSTTDRAIAAEPDINVFYQLALGRELRQKLKQSTCGRWDLDHVQAIHGQVARESSLTREFATLDLSNASDTLCRNLVRVLLPRRWFEALDSLRSPMTRINGRWVRLEKFSSMGNGFTFELETIVFAGLATVASRKLGHKGYLGRDVFVFGDDIIVKDDVVRCLSSVLRFCGFELNHSKSFHGDVPFRESCGQDFFNGSPVRPFFLKELPNGPQDLVALANGIRAVSERFAACGGSRLTRAWLRVLDALPSRVRRCRGPQALGDIVLHDDYEHWSTRWRHGIRYIQVIRPHRRRLVSYGLFHPDVVLACATYGLGGGLVGGVTPRDSVLSYKVGWTPFS